MARWEPREGEAVVDLRSTGRMHEPDRCGEVVTVKRVTDTLVITSDGEKYNRRHLTPHSEGRYSPRRLVSARDDRVLCVRGRKLLAEVARVAANLAAIDRRDPADIAGALAALTRQADEARRAYADVLAGKTSSEGQS